MRNGPWDSADAIRQAIKDKTYPMSITGQRPTGVETCKDEARFLFDEPRKEPLGFTKFAPFQQYYLSEK
jgi:hypothetical protein